VAAYEAAMATESNEHPTPRVVSLAPHLTIAGASAAIAFYERAFGARAGYVQKLPDGRVMHADLELPNGGVFFLNDDFPEHGGSRAPGASPSPVTIHVELNDIDAVWANALAAGAVVEMPLEDQFWGARYGVLRDPFGHRWSLGKQIKQPSRAELDSAVKSFGR
jgi:PhnB protein